MSQTLRPYAGSASIRPRKTASSQPLTECIVCGSAAFESVCPRKLPWLQRCTRCLIQFANPQPDERELSCIYDDKYYHTFGYSETDDEAYRAVKRMNCSKVLGTAEKLMAVGDLLDVGSALGDMLQFARECGWRVKGIEPNRYAVEQTDSEIADCMFCGTIEEYDGSSESFDVITCLDVLEHVRDPRSVMERFHELLRPGGCLLVTTVDVGSVAACALGAAWWHYHLDHLWYFHDAALRTLTESAGLNVLACHRANKMFNLRYIFEILARTERVMPIRWLSKAGVRCLPSKALAATFRLREGLFLCAQRPDLSVD